MNAKRAKAIRQALKAQGIDSSESAHISFKYTPTIRVDPESGRAVYQAAKKLRLNPFLGVQNEHC